MPKSWSVPWEWPVIQRSQFAAPPPPTSSQPSRHARPDSSQYAVQVRPPVRSNTSQYAAPPSTQICEPALWAASICGQTAWGTGQSSARSNPV